MRALRTSNLLLAVDPSLSASGWALFSLDNCLPCAIGVISPPGPAAAMAHRLSSLQETVVGTLEMLGLKPGDFLVCEGPAPLVLNPNSALKVERVRGIFEAVARTQQIAVPGRINPRTVQTELLGMRGKQLARTEVKAWARQTAERLFGDLLSDLPLYGVKRRTDSLPQDVVDALLIGCVAASRIQQSRQCSLEPEAMFEPRRHFQVGSGRRMNGWREQDVKRLRIKTDS